MNLGKFKSLLLLSAEIKTPPFSTEARRRAGFLLRMLQRGEALGLPDSRPMPVIGARCHELRIDDGQSRVAWRIVYRYDADYVIIADIFAKKTRATPADVIWRSRARLKRYDKDRQRL